MTREQVLINHIQEYLDSGMWQYEACYLNKDDLKVIIKALEQEPCEDCISRQAVLDLIEREEFKGDAISEIEKLSSVTPKFTDAEIQKMQELEQAEIQKAYELGKASQPKTGHWIRFKEFENGYYHIKCSECGQYWSVDGHAKIFRYCFNCGAKMEEVDF